MPRTIEMMTIGRSPRWDIVTDVADALGDSAILRQSGALDDLTDSEVAKLAPLSDADALIAALGHGTTAQVSKAAIDRLLQRRVERQDDETDAFAVLCTGIFPGLQADRRIVQVGEILLEAVAMHGHQPCIGVLIPISEQKEINEDLWAGHADKVITATASPYEGSAGVCAAARDLAADGATLIVLSCMGYSAAIHADVATAVGCPVIAPVQALIDHLKRRVLT